MANIRTQIQYNVEISLTELIDNIEKLRPYFDTLQIVEAISQRSDYVNLAVDSEEDARLVINTLKTRELVSEDVQEAEESAIPTKTLEIGSFTEYGKYYTVTFRGEAAIACSCPSFLNGGVNPCKHMRYVNANGAYYARQAR